MLSLDHLVRAWVVSHRIAPLNSILWFLSVIGRGGMAWLAIAGGLAVARRDRRAFTVVLLAVLMASALADYVVKPAVDRERPFDTMPGEVIGGKPHDASFPSGHSANAFAGALTLSHVAPGWSALWWTLASAIAFSRVYLGVHYPLDVLGGAALGLLSAWLAIRLTDR